MLRCLYDPHRKTTAVRPRLRVGVSDGVGTPRSVMVSTKNVGVAGFEPVRFEDSFTEQQEDVVGVVNPLRAEPAVTIVPLPYPFTVQTLQLRSEHLIEIGLRETAYR